MRGRSAVLLFIAACTFGLLYLITAGGWADSATHAAPMLAYGPTVGPTPTLSANLAPSIVAVYPCNPTGAACHDWNLRSGCGVNDLYVSVAAGTNYTALAAYRLDITDGGQVVVCRYTFRASDVFAGVKTIFLDEMRTPAGGQCATWPRSGVVKLYDPGGGLLHAVPYTVGAN